MYFHGSVFASPGHGGEICSSFGTVGVLSTRVGGAMALGQEARIGCVMTVGGSTDRLVSLPIRPVAIYLN